MALIKWRPKEEWDPFQDLLDLQDEMNRLFDLSLSRWPSRRPIIGERAWSMPLDICETKDSVVVKAELPGLKKNDINVSLTKDTLTIKGERKKEQELKDKHFHKLERFYGSFQRTISLPSYVDTSKVKATYKDGVLEITLPKSKEAKSREIQVRVE